MFCLTEIFQGTYQSGHNFIHCLGYCYISLNFIILENPVDLYNFFKKNFTSLVLSVLLLWAFTLILAFHFCINFVLFCFSFCKYMPGAVVSCRAKLRFWISRQCSMLSSVLFLYCGLMTLFGWPWKISCLIFSFLLCKMDL